MYVIINVFAYQIYCSKVQYYCLIMNIILNDRHFLYVFFKSLYQTFTISYIHVHYENTV